MTTWTTVPDAGSLAAGGPGYEREIQPPAGEPHGWIQWKGTDVCMDVHCACGALAHVDDEFAYYVRCAACGRTYRVNSTVQLVELTSDEAARVGHETTEACVARVDVASAGAVSAYAQLVVTLRRLLRDDDVDALSEARASGLATADRIEAALCDEERAWIRGHGATRKEPRQPGGAPRVRQLDGRPVARVGRGAVGDLTMKYGCNIDLSSTAHGKVVVTIGGNTVGPGMDSTNAQLVRMWLIDGGFDAIYVAARDLNRLRAEAATKWLEGALEELDRMTPEDQEALFATAPFERLRRAFAKAGRK